MCFRPPAAGKPVICPKCQKVNPPQEKQCKHCGEPLKKQPEN
ncbi:hypothetical protein [Desulfitobacterium hafniense]|nr:hypothetical protein [Desulfitobacterium hafniense]